MYFLSISKGVYPVPKLNKILLQLKDAFENLDALTYYLEIYFH